MNADQRRSAQDERLHWDPAKYDEEAEMTQYIWDHYSRLMSPLERRIQNAVTMSEKTASSSDRMKQAIRERCGDPQDPEFAELLKDGYAVFCIRAAARVLAEGAAELHINRCAKCHRIVATPKAKQCLWCGFDWHREP